MNLNMSRYTRKTMLMQLIAYFVLIIIITLSALSYFTYTYFSSSFKSEISDFNHKVLNQVSILSDEFILKSVNELASNQIMDTSESPELKAIFSSTSIDDWKIIFDAQYKLADLAFQSRDVVDSIFIHSRNNHHLVSSSSKVLKNIDEASIPATDEFSWVNAFYKSNKSILWLNTRNTHIYSNDNASMGDVITIICSYPTAATGAAVKGLIAVNIKEEALSNYLVKFNSGNAGQLMILDSDGTIVSHSSKSSLYNNISNEAFVKTILTSASSRDFITMYNNTEYVVSYVKSGINSWYNWYYVSLVPTELFYQKDDLIKKNIFFASLGILFILLILSNVLSFSIYTPFKKILEKYSSAAGISNMLQKSLSEYRLLDNLFSNMCTKLSDIQNTVSKNSMMIRHNLLIDLINNHYSAPDNLEKMLNLLNIRLTDRYYCAAVFLISGPDGNAIGSQSDMQIYKYSIIDFIDSIKGGNCVHIPVDIGKDSVCVILNTPYIQYEDIVQFVQDVGHYCCEKLNIQLLTGTGRYVEDLLSINKSYIDAKICLQYKFIMPQLHTFYYNEIAITGNSIPVEIIERFDKYLKLGNFTEVKETLDNFTAIVIRDHVPYREVRRTMSELVSTYRKFLEIMNISLEEIIHEQAGDLLLSPRSMYEFTSVLLQAVYNTNNYINSKKQNRYTELLDKIKQYVLDNLDQEISLNSTADAFHMSPFHLSKIFKEETGKNYIDYVMACKMDKAKNLLVSTNLTIEKITGLVGYSHATYFSRKFKELTGKTPYTYRNDAYLQSQTQK